ncbi:UNVERIFIED_CONTAM: hypothetical protein Sradi_5411000 [Sesamum radiatum]|uniref:Secreted protein n=1 Tax=Sesamum radiatum TaxID=300843 RepID=A0AAW2L925_SESRA
MAVATVVAAVEALHFQRAITRFLNLGEQSFDHPTTTTTPQSAAPQSPRCWTFWWAPTPEEAGQQSTLLAAPPPPLAIPPTDCDDESMFRVFHIFVGKSS